MSRVRSLCNLSIPTGFSNPYISISNTRNHSTNIIFNDNTAKFQVYLYRPISQNFSAVSIFKLIRPNLGLFKLWTQNKQRLQFYDQISAYTVFSIGFPLFQISKQNYDFGVATLPVTFRYTHRYITLKSTSFIPIKIEDWNTLYVDWFAIKFYRV